MSANFTPDFEKVQFTKPFRFWCQTVIPLVYDDSLSYYELLCKVVDYLNHTIKDVNDLTKNVDGLFIAFQQLQKYVNDYFDNLDVQEEINNKLDEMAKNGRLEQLIEQFLKYNTFRVFDSAVKLFANTGLYKGEYVTVLGHFSAGDGGYCSYVITDTATEFSTKTATSNLYANPLIVDTNVNPVVFGLQESNNSTENTEILNLAIRYSEYVHKNLIIPNGNYKFNDRIMFNAVDNMNIYIYATCDFDSYDSYKGCFNFFDCNNIYVHCLGTVKSTHSGKSTPPAGHYRPTPAGDKSSNRTAFHISNCKNVTIDGGYYTGLEYISQCTVDVTDPENPNERGGLSENIIYRNMVIEDTYQPFLSSFSENVTYSNLNITLKNGCGEGDHPFYVSRATKNFFFADCKIDMLTTYPLNVFKLSSAFAGSTSLDVAHIDNCTVSNLGAGFIALEQNTKAYINNCYVEFSDKEMPTDLPVSAYKTPYVYFLQNTSSVIDNNSIYINKRKNLTDNNYLNSLVLSANTNSLYQLDNCTYKGLKEFVSGGLSANVPTYDVKNCTIELSKWLFWLNNTNADVACKMSFANNTITSDFLSYLVVANGNTSLYFSNNYIKNVSDRGGLICSPNSVVSNNNYIIVNNTFENVAKIIDTNLAGNSIIKDNYLIKLNKLVDSVSTYNNFYVDDTNGDDKNSGSVDYPLKSLDRALALCENNVIENRIVIQNSDSFTVNNVYALNNKTIRITSASPVTVNINYATSFRINSLSLNATNILFTFDNPIICQNCSFELSKSAFNGTVLSMNNSFIAASNSTFYRLNLSNSTVSATDCTFSNDTDTDTIISNFASSVILNNTCTVAGLDTTAVTSAFINSSLSSTVSSSATITVTNNPNYYGLKANGNTLYMTGERYKQFDSVSNGGLFGGGGSSVTNSLIVHYNSEFNPPA